MSSDTTNFSKHFIAIEVRATGRKSLFTVAQGFLGTGVIIDSFHRAGTVWMLSDCWNIGHHVVVSSSAQLLSKKAGMPSGPAALPVRTLLKRWRMLVGSTSRQQVSTVSGRDTLLREVFTVESQVKVIQLVWFLVLVHGDYFFLCRVHISDWFHCVPKSFFIWHLEVMFHCLPMLFSCINEKLFELFLDNWQPCSVITSKGLLFPIYTVFYFFCYIGFFIVVDYNVFLGHHIANTKLYVVCYSYSSLIQF